MLKCGLLGEKLGHSYSPEIHALLGDYKYELYEKTPGEAEVFLRHGEFDGLNVTIPYKKTAAALCAQLSPVARKLGSVNTIAVRKGGDGSRHCTATTRTTRGLPRWCAKAAYGSKAASAWCWAAAAPR
jgi:shikimate 5-dehydrogenase